MTFRATALAALLVIPVLLAAGCDPTESEAGPHLDRAPLLTLVEGTRLGDFDDPDRGFSRVLGLAVDDQGAPWIVEGSVPEIRRYGPDGSVEARIGRRGEGPGEFMSVQRFGVQGDTLWTFDSSLMRITLLDRTGNVLSTATVEGIPVPLPEATGYVSPYQMRPDGLFTGSMNRVVFYRSAPPTGVSPTDSIPVPMVLFDPEGKGVDTIGWAGRPPPRLWRPPSEQPEEPSRIQAGERSIWVPVAPSTLPNWLPTPDGYVLVETPRPQGPRDHDMYVTRIGLEGDTIYGRAVSYEPVPFTSGGLDAIAEAAARGESGPRIMGAGAPEPPSDWQAIARRVRAEMDFPDYQLPIRSSWLAQDESIWLQRTARGDSAESGLPRWAVLDPEGRLRGEVRLAPGARPLWHRADTVWILELDEFDVPWVVRYRLEG